MATVDLCSLSDVRGELELPTSDTTRDSLISTMVTAISRALMMYCEREFKTETSGFTTRRFEVPFDSLFLNLAPWDINAIDDLVVTINPEQDSGTTVTAIIEYQASPTQPRHTYTGIRFSPDLGLFHASQTARRFGYTLVDVGTAHWGFASVPEDVKRAAIITVAANMDRRVDGFAMTADLIDSDAHLMPAHQSSFAIPTAALALLGPYRRAVGAF